MRTLTYGLQVPETGDKGDVIFPAMEANIEQLDAHAHNGSDSPKLDRKAIDSISQTALAASWASQGNGIYRQTITMPAGLLFDTVSIETRLSTGEVVDLEIEKVTANTFYLYINDNTQTVTILYG